MKPIPGVHLFLVEPAPVPSNRHGPETSAGLTVKKGGRSTSDGIHMSDFLPIIPCFGRKGPKVGGELDLKGRGRIFKAGPQHSRENQRQNLSIGNGQRGPRGYKGRKVPGIGGFKSYPGPTLKEFGHVAKQFRKYLFYTRA